MSYTPKDIPSARPISALAAIPYASTATAPDEQFPLAPMRRWRAIIDLLAIFILVFGSQIALHKSGIGSFIAENWPGLGGLALNLPFGAVALLGIWLVLRLRRQAAETIGLNRASGVRILVATIIAVPAALIASMTTNLLYIAASGADAREFMDQRIEFFDMIPVIPSWGVILFSLFVGLHEEALFRGFLLSRLRAICGSTVAAVILTSILFGLPHIYQGTSGVFQTAAVGLVLAIITAYTRTLWPAILAHALFNTIGLTLIPWLMRVLEETGMVGATWE